MVMQIQLYTLWVENLNCKVLILESNSLFFSFIDTNRHPTEKWSVCLSLTDNANARIKHLAGEFS